jgi:hypothetical protein
MFIIMGSEISTVNLRHSSASAVTQDRDAVRLIKRLLKEYGEGGVKAAGDD